MYTSSSHVLMFRSKPVFDMQKKPKWFSEEGRIPIPIPTDDMRDIDMESVRSMIYECYDDVNILTSELIDMVDHLVSTCRQRECPIGDVREYVISDASVFIMYFYVNHEELTTYQTWSGSDVRMLLYYVCLSGVAGALSSTQRMDRV